MTKNQQIEKREVKLFAQVKGLKRHHQWDFNSLPKNEQNEWRKLARKLIRLEKEVKKWQRRALPVIIRMEIEDRELEEKKAKKADRLNRKKAKANAVRIWNSKPYDE